MDMRGQPPRRESGVPSLLLPLGFLLAALLLVICTLPYLMTSPEQQALATVGGPFRLADSGGTVTERSWPGKFLLVYFGYTHCPSACPTTLASIGSALDRLGPAADRVQPLFITVDPVRDTPAAMGRYVALFSPRLAGLSGTPDQISDAATRFRIFIARHQTGPGPDDYEMEHSHVVYLMSPTGHLARAIPADATPEAMASEIAKIVAPRSI